jgi:hypothetical protein
MSVRLVWERVWVLQAACLAKRLLILCGDRAVLRVHFAALLAGLNDTVLKNVCLGRNYRVRQDRTDAFATANQFNLDQMEYGIMGIGLRP